MIADHGSGMTVTRRQALLGFTALPLAPLLGSTETRSAGQLIAAARARIGVTTLYDPAYVSLAYPGGDVRDDRGVCIDVIIRAYRTAFGFDFQQHLHEDMKANFAAYPKIWGLSRTDRNIDHRRVPNVETWLSRHGHELPVRDWRPGDLMTCRVGGSLPHIGILTDRRGRDGHWMAVHNIGLGTHEDSRIWGYSHKRRFRFLPEPIDA
ncbi:MAG: DUF1287 domain-containing protein [Pseudomonadota bacterium]